MTAERDDHRPEGKRDILVQRRQRARCDTDQNAAQRKQGLGHLRLSGPLLCGRRCYAPTLAQRRRPP
jgi:hypothetical protein